MSGFASSPRSTGANSWLGAPSEDVPIAAESVSLLVCSAAVPFDLRFRRIPNTLSAVGLTSILLLSGVNGGASGALGSLGTALACASVPFALHLADADSMGGGDVKLCLVLGAGLGAASLAALVIGALAAVIWTVLNCAARRLPIAGATVPFAPFLAAGAFTSVLAG